MPFTSFRVTEGEYPNFLIIGYTPSQQLIRTVFKQVVIIKVVFFLCPPKISSSVERSIGMEFVLSLDSLLCPHTMDNGQEQKVAHLGKCRLWVDLQKLSSKVTETGGQLPHS